MRFVGEKTERTYHEHELYQLRKGRESVRAFDLCGVCGQVEGPTTPDEPPDVSA
jgi:hypothetical protein